VKARERKVVRERRAAAWRHRKKQRHPNPRITRTGCRITSRARMTPLTASLLLVPLRLASPSPRLVLTVFADNW
jgi:hypothetical protein